MNARQTATCYRSRKSAVAVRGALSCIARSSSMASMAKRLQPQQHTSLHGNGSQPQWLGNGFEDTAPPPGGGCNAGQ